MYEKRVGGADEAAPSETPRTKISLLICALQRKGSRWKVREQGPRTFLLDLAEKNGKLIKCSYIKKQNKTKKLRDWK